MIILGFYLEWNKGFFLVDFFFFLKQIDSTVGDVLDRFNFL